MATVPNPKTWAVEFVDVAEMNLELRDALNFLLNPPRALATTATATSIVTATWTPVPLETETFDTDAMHSTSVNTSRLTCVTAGIYKLSAGVCFAGNATGIRQAKYTKNGADLPSRVTYIPPATTAAFAPPSILIALVAGDYVELQVYQSSGAGLAISNAADAGNWLSALWVSK